MFYPTLYPTFTNPYNSFIDTADNLQEIGDSINISFTASFNRGSISPEYGTNGFRSGNVNTYHYTGTGLPASVIESSASNDQNITNYSVLRGSQSWSSRVSYDAGEQPLDSEGGNYDSPYPQGTTTYQTVSFEGVWPLFGTTVNITTYTQQPLVSMLSGNQIEFDMVPETDIDRQTFEIAEGWILSRPILSVETFNPFSGIWEFQGGTAATSLSYWPSIDIQKTIQGVLTNYKRHSFNGTVRSSIKIRLNF